MSLLFLSLTSFFCLVTPRRLVGTVPAHVCHGINNFNGERIADLSEITNFIRRLGTPVYEMAAQNTSGNIPIKITDSTDENLLIVTTNTLNTALGFPDIDDSLVNTPIANIGSYYLSTKDAKDRIHVLNWDEVDTRGEIHHTSYTETGSDITLHDWNSASGKLTVYSINDNLYDITIEICGFADSIYTIWEAGVHNTLTDNEQFFFVPGGGMPHLIITDRFGYGKRNWLSKWNPLSECVPNESCTFDINIVYNWDRQTYGASPDLVRQGMPGGVINSNHILFITAGNVLQQPKNEFSGKFCGRRND